MCALRVALLAGTALTFVALPAQAQVAQTWTGNVSTDWFTAGNWDSNTTPATGDSVTIDAVSPNPTIASGTAVGYAAIDLNGVNVGFTATGNLTANNGASVTVTNNNFVVGGDLGGTFPGATGTVVFDNATLTVTGAPPGSGTIFVGASGTGSFTAQNGSTVTTVDSYVGHLQGSTGTVTVNGSAWTNSGSNYIGNFGTGVFNVLTGGTVTVAGDTIIGVEATGAGTMNITGSGQVTTNGLAFLGYRSGSTGTVVIDGATSVWTAPGGVLIGGNNIGDAGGNGTVTVRNGGTFDTTNAGGGVVLLGSDVTATSSGTVTVTGAGSTWTADSVFVGWNGRGTVNILDGSTFSTTGDLSVGTCNCSVGTMTVSGGSTVTVGGNLNIAEDSGSTGTMTVSGSGTSVTVTTPPGFLSVGNLGTGTLNVLDGASVTAPDVFVGFGTGSNGTLNITGTGSSLTANGKISVGDVAGSNGIVNVSGTGVGFGLIATGDLTVGNDGTGTLNVQSGGSVSAANAIIGKSAGSSGTVTVSGANAALTATGDLTVGDSGTGTLNVQSGGAVTAVNGIIGNNAGSSGTVNVSGAGSTLTLTGGLLIGLGGVGTGAFNLTDGGVANVTGNVLNGDRLFVGAGSVLNAGGYGATAGVTTGFGLRSSSSGQIDVGAGVAALAGALVVSGHNSVRTTYTLINSGNLGGTTFDTVTYTSPLRNPVLTYTVGGDVTLTVDAFQLAAALPSNATDNQRGVARALDNVVAGGTSLPTGFDTAYNLTGDALLSALTQLSGEIGTTPQQAVFTASNQFMNLLFNQGAGAPGGGFTPTNYAPEKKVDPKAAEAYAAVTPRDRRAPDLTNRWGVWGSAYGGNATVKGDGGTGSSDTTSRVYGLAAGADYSFSQDTVVGFALGGAGTNFSTLGGSGSADIFQAGLYARHYMGAAYVSGALGYGWQNVTTDRTVTVFGTDKLHANFSAQTLAARLEGGYRFVTPWAGLTPYAALQSTSFFLPSYAESAVSGSSQFALSYASQTETNLRTELGLRADRSFITAQGLLNLYGRAAWAHDSNTDRPATATFQSLPGATFTVNGAKPAPDGALLTAGAEMKWLNGWSLAGTFDGEFSRTTASYAGRGTLRYVW